MHSFQHTWAFQPQPFAAHLPSEMSSESEDLSLPSTRTKNGLPLLPYNPIIPSTNMEHLLLTRHSPSIRDINDKAPSRLHSGWGQK